MSRQSGQVLKVREAIVSLHSTSWSLLKLLRPIQQCHGHPCGMMPAFMPCSFLFCLHTPIWVSFTCKIQIRVSPSHLSALQELALPLRSLKEQRRVRVPEFQCIFSRRVGICRRFLARFWSRSGFCRSCHCKRIAFTFQVGIRVFCHKLLYTKTSQGNAQMPVSNICKKSSDQLQRLTSIAKDSYPNRELLLWAMYR